MTPRGIEILVKKALVDGAFRRQLLTERSGAAERIGLALDPAEAAMLDAIPEAQLVAIIEKTFETGRAKLERYGVPVEALVRICAMEEGGPFCFED